MPSVVVPNTATSEFSYSVSYLTNTTGQVWYLIVSIPDTLTYFAIVYRLNVVTHAISSREVELDYGYKRLGSVIQIYEAKIVVFGEKHDMLRI